MFEKASPKHPDKIADRIAGAIVDIAYLEEENPRVAVEVLVGHGTCLIIIESNIDFNTIEKMKDVTAIVKRIAGDNIHTTVVSKVQDSRLSQNQSQAIKCGDNGIFRGVPVTDEQKQLKDVAMYLYDKYNSDGKCQVCRDHPRFRSYFGDTVEMGLGFCCEQATRVILTFEDKIQPILTSDFNNDDKLDFIQKSVLQFKNKALAVIQDRQVDVNQRIEQILSLCNAKGRQKDFDKTLKTFLSLERLNKSWTKRLKSIRNKKFTYTISDDLSLCAEQFLVNSLYRHLSDAEDATWVRARAIACVLSWYIIYNIFEQEQIKDADNFNLLVDIVREYSAEVEYSQNNLDKLFSFVCGLIKTS